MVRYREVIYNQYFSTQVNKLKVDPFQLLNQQVHHNTCELIHLLPEDRTVSIVDLGCGFGSFVKAALQAGYQNTTGCDISSEQVSKAHKLGITQVKHQSIDDHFASSGKSDVIVGLDIIEHFTKDELIDFLLNVKAHLNPGGRVIFRTPNMDAPQASLYAFGDISHENFMNKSSALQVMRSVGFSSVEVFGGRVNVQGTVKEMLRRVIWSCYKFSRKLMLFASARTWHNVVFEPNMIIVASVDQ